MLIPEDNDCRHGLWNTVEIDLAALRGNYRLIQKKVGPRVRIMAVVKADAYGHGLIRSAKALAEAGVRCFGVAEAGEGLLLRQAGLRGEIIVLLGVTPESYNDVIRSRLQPVVFDMASLAGLSAAAVAQNDKIGIHLKVDVGMGRLGIMPAEVDAFAEALPRMAGLYLSGIMSHFPLADDPDPHRNQEQLAIFTAVLERFGAAAAPAKIRHIANSAALLHDIDTHFDMVRPGITLYGCYPGSPEADQALPGLRPVLSFKTRVLQIKAVPADYGLSYGHTFVTARPSRLAVLPVGYHNGYLRKLSNRAAVLIKGRRAPVRGRVCMNACVVDVTDLPTVRPGDEAVLLGRQGGAEITADEVAGWLETISYEVLCLFGNRNRRIYVDT